MYDGRENAKQPADNKWEGLSSLGKDLYTILSRVYYTGIWQESFANKFGCRDVSKDAIMAIFYNITHFNSKGSVWKRSMDNESIDKVQEKYKSMAFCYLRLNMPDIYKLTTLRLSSLNPITYEVQCTFFQESIELDF